MELRPDLAVSQRARPFELLPGRASSLLVHLLALMVASGCDESFSPIEPSDLQFSVFGYLDAAADTQWIRVMPIRPTTLTSPGPLGALVTLEHLGSGRVIELRDSVFRFELGAEIGSEGVYLHNFWTTERIEPGSSYRFSVKREGEPPSESVVEIPADYDTEVWIAQPYAGGGDYLRLLGLKHLAYTMVTRFYDNCGQGVYQTPLATHADVQMIPISKRIAFREGCGAPQVEKRELLVIGSGAAWPSGREYSSSGLGVPDVPSNVSNAVGFLGGVLTKVVPYEECLIESPVPRPDPCQLRYDDASVTLSGTVQSVCGGTGIPQAEARLREIDPDPAGRRRIRTASTNQSGGFEIGGLEAGRRYALGIRRLSPEFRDLYQEYGDTLEFTAGQRLTYNAALIPVNPCGTNESATQPALPRVWR